MSSYSLPLAGGVTGQILHPLNVATVMSEVLYCTLRSFSPATLVIKRVRRSRSGRHGTASSQHRRPHSQHRPTSVVSGGEDANDGGGSSVAPSVVEDDRGSTQHHNESEVDSVVSRGGGDVETDAVGRRSASGHRSQHGVPSGDSAHRRHRSSSSGRRGGGEGLKEDGARTHSSSRRHHSKESPAEGGRKAQEEDAAGEHRPLRARSADETRTRLLQGGKNGGGSGSGRHTPSPSSARRSRSDEGRSSGARPSATSLQGLSSSARLHSNNSSFGSTSGPPPPPPPPMLGKPPLSGRRSTATPSTPHDAGTGSAGGALLQPPPSLTPRSRSPHGGKSTPTSAGRGREEAERGGAPQRTPSGHRRRHHQRTMSSSSPTGRPHHRTHGTSRSGTGKTLRERMAGIDCTSQAYFLAHVLRAVPVLAVHVVCELERQVAALPMLRFRDIGRRAVALLGCYLPLPASSTTATTTSAAPTSRAKETRSTVATGGGGALLSDVGTTSSFLIARTVCRLVDTYLEEDYFLDDSMVARNLRSKRFSRQAIGWTLRLASHTLLDPVFLSVVVPLLCVASYDQGPDSDGRLTPGPVWTVPGMLRAAVNSGASVLLEFLVKPTFSQLVNRAVVTVCESTEYVIMRRYRTWSDEEDDEEESEGLYSDEEEDGEVEAAPDGKGDSAAALGRGAAAAATASEGTGSSRAVTPRSTALGEEATAAGGGDEKGGGGSSSQAKEARLRRRLARERRAQRELRQAQRDAAARRAVFRAIIYRVVASLVAQCVVNHPLEVLAEVLRGRATMNALGLLAPYDQATTAADGLSWPHVRRFFRDHYIADAVGAEDGAGGVPPAVAMLRDAGAAIGHEIRMVSASVRDVSGHGPAIDQLMRRAREGIASGARPSARESVELLRESVFSCGPLYEGVQFTVMDRLLSFYMAVWTRLTKQ